MDTMALVPEKLLRKEAANNEFQTMRLPTISMPVAVVAFAVIRLNSKSHPLGDMPRASGCCLCCECPP